MPYRCLPIGLEVNVHDVSNLLVRRVEISHDKVTAVRTEHFVVDLDLDLARLEKKLIIISKNNH